MNVPYPTSPPVATLSYDHLGALLDELKPSQMRLMLYAFAGANPEQFDAALVQAAHPLAVAPR